MKYFVYILIIQQSFAISLLWGVSVIRSASSRDIIPNLFCIPFLHNFDLCLWLLQDYSSTWPHGLWCCVVWWHFSDTVTLLLDTQYHIWENSSHLTHCQYNCKFHICTCSDQHNTLMQTTWDDLESLCLQKTASLIILS